MVEPTLATCPIFRRHLKPHRADLEAGWVHMLDHQLPALLPVDAFWDALPEIFDWLHGQIAPVLAAMPMGGGDALIRDRIINLPAGSLGQTHIDLIRFAAANRLLVEIDYQDKTGKRSTRAIEAYSLRRSQAGDVRLMAVRATDGQPRAYLLNSILGVRPTQTSFAPRYPIELTPTGPQSIPRTPSSSGGIVARRAAPAPKRAFRAASSGGPTYVFRCPVCGKTFNRKTYDGALNPHKNKSGFACYGTYGAHVKTTY
jgi:hypothetical protein